VYNAKLNDVKTHASKDNLHRTQWTYKSPLHIYIIVARESVTYIYIYL